MEPTLSGEERQQLRLIARALEKNERFEIDPALVESLIKKCMVRTWGDTLKLTAQGSIEAKES